MKRAEFKKLLSELENLSYKQKMELLKVIKQLSKPDEALESIGTPRENADIVKVKAITNGVRNQGYRDINVENAKKIQPSYK